MKLQFYERKLNLPYNNLIYEYLVDYHFQNLKEDAKYKDAYYNFLVSDKKFFDFFDTLYEQFYQQSVKIFGQLTLMPDNRRSCWIQVSNKHDIGGKQLIHNHIQSSIINGVYYFCVPEKNTGKIVFCDRYENIISKYQPSENTLLIFPNYLNHYPEVCDSELFRIAINMEILCEEDVWMTKTY